MSGTGGTGGPGGTGGFGGAGGAGGSGGRGNGWVATLLGGLTLGVMALAVAVGFYWLVLQEDVLTITSEAQTEKTEYAPGEIVRYTFDYCKSQPAIGLVSRLLVDGYAIPYDTITSDLPEGCHERKMCSVRIPTFASPGIYFIKVSVDYPLNPLRRSITRYRTTNFTVTGVSASREFWNGQTMNNSDRLDRLERK